MRSISSASNARYKHIRRLLSERRYRTKQDAFVIEGSRWLDELRREEVTPELIVLTDGWAMANQDLLDNFAGKSQVLTITQELLATLSDTKTPSGVLAIVKKQTRPWPAAPTLVVALDGIRDPGNLGTLMRSAAAAKTDGLLLGPGTVDPYSPKVVRSTMGALLRVPFRAGNWETLKAHFSDGPIYAAGTGGAIAHWDIDWQQPATLIIGNEAHGLSDKALELATQMVEIPMPGVAESLNAGVAGSIILFEAVRQRMSGHQESR